MRKVIPSDAVLVPDGAKCVFEGIIYKLFQWPQTMFDGSVETFEMLCRTDTVSILAIKDGKLMTQTEEQPHLGPRFGVPMGRVDATDKDWLAAAKRECKEETGFTFKSWRMVHVEQPLAKIEWFNAVFIAWDLESESEPEQDKGEKIVPALSELRDAKAAFEGDIRRTGVTAVLEKVETLEELLNLPEFEGKIIER